MQSFAFVALIASWLLAYMKIKPANDLYGNIVAFIKRAYGSDICWRVHSNVLVVSTVHMRDRVLDC